MIQLKNFIAKNIGILLLFISLLIGLFNFSNYGMSWDEKMQRSIGLVNFEYVFSDNQELLTFFGRDYGVAIELPLVIIEKALGLEDSRDIYLTRHLILHVFFLFSAFICFLLVDLLYKNKLLASIGFLLFLLSPVLYAHSYINSKDIPFACMFLICFYLNALAFRKQKVVYYFLLGIGVGVLINIRIMGVLLFCCVLFFSAIDFIISKQDKVENRKRIQLLLIFCTTAFITLYLTWPILYEKPIINFLVAFKNMTRFPWNELILFNGQSIRAADVPWNYIPVWFIITTPIFYLIIGFTGIALLLFHFVKTPALFLKNTLNRNNLVFIICFFVPVIAVIVLKSVLYDGWRHMYFIYPSFVLLCIYGLDKILQSKFKTAISVVTFISFAYTAYFMVVNNPHQQVYFNELVDTKTPEKLRKQFELDYWGMSYKQSLEYILKEDKSPSINIAVANEPGVYNLEILSPEDRKRVHAVKMEDAKYFITNYRWHPEDYAEFQDKKWHSIKVNNNTINEIFKLK